MDKQQLKRLIGMIESAGGRNTNHAVMKYGMHKGQHAIGTYGLLPNTIEELIARAGANATPEDKALKGTTPEQKYEYFKKNPKAEEVFADRLAQLVMSRQPDVDRAAYSWNQGHNLDPKDITTAKLNNSDYVQKFRRLQKEPSQRSPILRQMAKKGAPPIDLNSQLDAYKDPATEVSEEDILNAFRENTE